MSSEANENGVEVTSSPCESPALIEAEEEIVDDVTEEKPTDTKQADQPKKLEEALNALALEGEDDEGNTNEDGEEDEERNEDFVCTICDEKFKMPKVLQCLHVFCQECLEKQLEPSTPDEADKSAQTHVIVCPICNQDTQVGSKGVAELQPDNVMVNLQDMEAIQKMKILCTSCKAKEKAIARCSDCANFLCSNCVTAHQYMRCFENHKVVFFEDMGSSFKLHKPLFCVHHSTEGLKYFCKTCQIPVCTECMVTTHKLPEHDCERIGELDDKLKNEVTSLVKEARGKVDYCEHASTKLENCLTELQMQRDNARGLIEETFQTYRTILEQRKDALLSELEDLHNQQQDTIMHVFDNVGKTIEKIEDSCKFTERVMEHGNCTEVLLVKRLIFTQLMSLINNTPKADVNVKIEFDTDNDKFQQAVAATFGCFKKQAVTKEPASQSLHSSFEGEGISLPSSLLSPEAALLTSLPPLSLPNMSVPPNLSDVSPQTINSIASSIQTFLTGTGVATPPPPHAPPPVAPVVSQTAVAQQAERSASRNSYSPAMSDSGISVDTASNGSASVNFAALQRLGSVNANSQGQILVNGTLIPGLNVSNVQGFPPLAGVGQRSNTPTTPDPGLASLLGGMNPPPALTRPRPTTPLGDLTTVTSQPPPAGAVPAILDPAHLPGLSMRSPTGGFNIPAVNPVTAARGSGRMNPMQIRCKFGQLGPGKCQFNSPHGFCLGIDEDIVVADTNNHRVQVFEKTGEFKYQFGIPGREEGQLWYPRKVAVIHNSGKYVVCDRGNERSRMQIFSKNGHFIKKIAIRYIDIVAGLAISQAGHIVAVDSVSPTVFVIEENGDLVKWFDCSDYMREPSDIAVGGKEYYVCDFKGHCVVVFNEDGQFMRRIGCENITNFPNGIDISDDGDVLVGDSHGNRFHVGVFQRDGSLIGEFECPYVKVSRCCGLKITREGYVVTLAKNNHHVLVLNTLYIS